MLQVEAYGTLLRRILQEIVSVFMDFLTVK